MPEDRHQLTSHELLGLLFDTKTPQIFAESAVKGDGSDWNNEGSRLLGDVSVAVPMGIYDNGQHEDPPGNFASRQTFVVACEPRQISIVHPDGVKGWS